MEDCVEVDASASAPAAAVGESEALARCLGRQAALSSAWADSRPRAFWSGLRGRTSASGALAGLEPGQAPHLKDALYVWA